MAERVVPASLRPDGTVRKEIRVRAGYVPAEDVQRFETKRQQQLSARSEALGRVVGMAPKGSASNSCISSNSSKKSCNSITASGIVNTEEAAKKAADIQRKLEAQEAKKAKKAASNQTEQGFETAAKEDADAKTMPVEAVNKQLKALKKKQRQIEQLKQKSESGVQLSEDQMAKLAKMTEVELEIRNLETLISALEIA